VNIAAPQRLAVIVAHLDLTLRVKVRSGTQFTHTLVSYHSICYDLDHGGHERLPIMRSPPPARSISSQAIAHPRSKLFDTVLIRLRYVLEPAVLSFMPTTWVTRVRGLETD